MRLLIRHGVALLMIIFVFPILNAIRLESEGLIDRKRGPRHR